MRGRGRPPTLQGTVQPGCTAASKLMEGSRSLAGGGEGARRIQNSDGVVAGAQYRMPGRSRSRAGSGGRMDLASPYAAAAFRPPSSVAWGDLQCGAVAPGEQRNVPRAVARTCPVSPCARGLHPFHCSGAGAGAGGGGQYQVRVRVAPSPRGRADPLVSSTSFMALSFCSSAGD